MIKILIAKEFTVNDVAVESLGVGEKYSYFVDPETGKYYRPNDGFKVTATGETDLADLFVEVESASE